RGDVVEVRLDGGEGLREPSLDRLRQAVTELLELLEARLEIGPLDRQLLEALLLRLVLLLGERVDLPELLPPPLVASELLRQRLAILALGRLRVRGVEPPLRLVVLGVGARELDIDRGQPLARPGRALSQLELVGAESAERRAELGRVRRLCLRAAAHRRLEPLHLHRQ